MSRRLVKAVVSQVVADVLAGTDVRPLELFTRSQAHRVAHRRQEVMVRLRSITDEGGNPLYSYPEIGRAFGRDHTTVIHALRQFSKRIHKQVESGGQTPAGDNGAVQRLPEAADC